MKQVCVNAATCSCTAATTRGALAPTLVTAMPEPRSMSWLPSTSTTMPPSARSANTGMVVATPAATAACLRAISRRETGPGISVWRSRCCPTVGAGTSKVVTRRVSERRSMLSNTRSAPDPCPSDIGGAVQLRHVRYFVATADAGSVSAAAARVHVTQPALSRQLRQLEQDLGVTLFDRSAGRLALNRTGRALLPAARDLLASADALQRRAGYHAGGGLERVTIAAPTVTLTDIVSPFVATMSADDPVVDVLQGDGRTTTELLQAGADL